MSTIREQMLADLGVASEPEALTLNGWMFDHVRKPGSQARTKWHWFETATGGQIVSACGKVALALGTKLAVTGHLAPSACKECLAVFNGRKVAS